MLRPFMCPFRGQCLPIVCVQAIAGCSTNQLCKCKVSTIDFSKYSNLIRFYVALTLQRANLRRFNRTCVCKVSRGGTLRNNLCLVWYMSTPIVVLLYVYPLLLYFLYPMSTLQNIIILYARTHARIHIQLYAKYVFLFMLCGVLRF